MKSKREVYGRRLGDLEGIREASGRHLGGISEATGRLKWPRGVLDVKVVQNFLLYSKIHVTDHFVSTRREQVSQSAVKMHTFAQPLTGN